MRDVVSAFFIGLLGLAISGTVPPETIEEFSGKVVALSDGDTITVLKDRKQIKVRLEGIDAPEKNQAFGSKSKTALSDLVGGKTVTVHKTGEDRYGRTLARVIADQQDLSALMVSQGMAWHYKEYSDDEDLAKLEERARADKVGLWADENALPPWEFRKRRKINDSPPQAFVASNEPSESSASQKPEPAQTATHWLNTGSNTRHNSRCQYFHNTKKGRSCGPNEGKACGTCGG